MRQQPCTLNVQFGQYGLNAKYDLGLDGFCNSCLIEGTFIRQISCSKYLAPSLLLGTTYDQKFSPLKQLRCQQISFRDVGIFDEENAHLK